LGYYTRPAKNRVALGRSDVTDDVPYGQNAL
jgi:hypothetical protein